MNKVLGALLFSALALGGCASSTYLAKVNDETITDKLLKQEFQRRHGGHEKFLAGPVEVRKFLDTVVDWRLLLQESYRLGLQDNADVVRATAERSAQEEVNFLVKAEIEDKAVPTPEQVRSAWERKTLELVQVRQIVVESHADAEAIVLELLAGADFDGLARECSIAPSRLYGGRMPLLGWGAMDPDWEEVAFGLSPGELSAILPNREGWEILQLESRSVAERPPFEKAAPRIEGILKKRMLDQRKREFSKLLWSKYHAQVAVIAADPASLRSARPDAVIASWDGGQLTLAEIASPAELDSLAGLPPARLASHFGDLLRATVNDALVREEARRRRIDQVPEVAEVIRSYREELMERVLYEDYVLKDVAVTEAEVRAEFDGRPGELVKPEKRRVAHILVETSEEARDLRRRIANGESFEDLARTRSKDAASAPQGGDLGWIVRKDAAGDFTAVLSLKEGEVSEPLKSKFGYHLVKVTKLLPERPLSYEEAREDLRKKILERKQQQKRREWVEKLRAAATIHVSDAGIRAFVRANEIK